MEKVTMSVQELSAQMGISFPKAYEPGQDAQLSAYKGQDKDIDPG